MQNINNRVHSSGKTYVKSSQAKLQRHSPLSGTEQPGSCCLFPTAVGAHCASLSLCIGLFWRPNSKSSISRSLLALCEAVAGTKTAVSHCLIGFLIRVWWMTVFSLLLPPLPSFSHLSQKGTRGKKEKNRKVQHMVADTPSLTLNWDFKMVPLVVNCKVPTKRLQGETKAWN